MYELRQSQRAARARDGEKRAAEGVWVGAHLGSRRRRPTLQQAREAEAEADDLLATFSARKSGGLVITETPSVWKASQPGPAKGRDPSTDSLAEADGDDGAESPGPVAWRDVLPPAPVPRDQGPRSAEALGSGQPVPARPLAPVGQADLLGLPSSPMQADASHRRRADGSRPWRNPPRSASPGGPRRPATSQPAATSRPFTPSARCPPGTADAALRGRGLGGILAPLADGFRPTHGALVRGGGFPSGAIHVSRRPSRSGTAGGGPVSRPLSVTPASASPAWALRQRAAASPGHDVGRPHAADAEVSDTASILMQSLSIRGGLALEAERRPTPERRGAARPHRRTGAARPPALGSVGSASPASLASWADLPPSPSPSLGPSASLNLLPRRGAVAPSFRPAEERRPLTHGGTLSSVLPSPAQSPVKLTGSQPCSFGWGSGDGTGSPAGAAPTPTGASASARLVAPVPAGASASARLVAHTPTHASSGDRDGGPGDGAAPWADASQRRFSAVSRPVDHHRLSPSQPGTVPAPSALDLSARSALRDTFTARDRDARAGLRPGQQRMLPVSRSAAELAGRRAAIGAGLRHGPASAHRKRAGTAGQGVRPAMDLPRPPEEYRARDRNALRARIPQRTESMGSVGLLSPESAKMVPSFLDSRHAPTSSHVARRFGPDAVVSPIDRRMLGPEPHAPATPAVADFEARGRPHMLSGSGSRRAEARKVARAALEQGLMRRQRQRA